MSLGAKEKSRRDSESTKPERHVEATFGYATHRGAFYGSSCRNATDARASSAMVVGDAMAGDDTAAAVVAAWFAARICP